MTRVPRLAVAALGGIGALVLVGGVASAVVRAHTDPAVALPAVCRDNPGAAGGALPSGRALQQALGRGDSGSAGTPAATVLAAGGQLGTGTATELQLRAQALTGGGSDSGAAAHSSGTSPGLGQLPRPQGDAGGSGGGAGGPGGAGSGGRSGNQTGALGGSGTAPLAGNGPDRSGIPQQPQPIIPPPVVPPVTPPVQHHSRPNAAGTVLLVLVLLLLTGLGYLALRSSKRRSNGELPDGTGLAPGDAEALAARAIEVGDLDLALRWTFVSGLLRLSDVGVLPYDASRPTLECSRRVPSERFPVLAAGFDLVAYGRRHATLADVVAAREAWAMLVREVAVVR